LNKHDKLTGLYNRAFLDYYIDEIIIDVAKKIEVSCRENDKIFRVGGDEFLIILPNASAEAGI